VSDMREKADTKVGVDYPLERIGEVTTIMEMAAPWVGTDTALVIFTAAVPPGVQWHCINCNRHDKATTLLQRPKHCGTDMELDDWRSLYDYFEV
jgi:hypothetical protein